MVNGLSWKKNIPEKAEGFHIVAIKYPSATVYELLARTSNPMDGHFWSGFESRVGKAVAYIPLVDVLVDLCGTSLPSGQHSDRSTISPLAWSAGDLPKDGLLLVSTPIEYDLVEWFGDDIGWPSYIHHVKGYIRVLDLLNKVSEHFPYQD
ncbi:hypothetical protein [Sessilibacter corallicola]|uniref:Uncharacterized protein n=1 Tax=Sessilibacter corallicola TaxID=2904075 RepID=A0ABQ0ABG1_9GAMM